VLSQFINSIFVWNQSRLFRTQFNPGKFQLDLLGEIVKRNRKVPYLSDRGISDVKSFIEKCPLVEYDDIENMILQIQTQDVNHLCTDDVMAFAKSSGTTSRSKFIPLTRKGIEANFVGGRTMLTHYIANNPKSKIFEGKNFSLTGSYSKVGNYIVGDVSALFTYFLSPWYKPFRVPNIQLATIPDWNEKLEKIIPLLANADIRWIAGVPSWMRIVVDRVEDYAQKDIRDVWKNLEVYFYGGVGIKPFEPYFHSKFGRSLKLWQTYNASEGFFGLQVNNDREDMGLLWNTQNYYEFIPYQDLDSSSPNMVSLSALEKYTVYELVITNCSGLYRYRMGDLIRIKNLNPLRFEIVGRTKNSINVFGEELMVSNTEMAISLLNREMEFLIKDYTVAPMISGNSGHHHWQIEFFLAPSDMGKFQNRLDEILRMLNSDYDAKRFDNMILKPLTVEILQANSFDRWLEMNDRKTVQAKVPKLWKDNSIQRQLTAIKLL